MVFLQCGGVLLLLLPSSIFRKVRIWVTVVAMMLFFINAIDSFLMPLGLLVFFGGKVPPSSLLGNKGTSLMCVAG